MNKKITLKTKDNIYSINIEANSIVKNLNKIINTNNKVVFLIDRKVFYIFKKLKNYKNQKYLCIDCSEKLKSFSNYAKISEKILNFKIDRGTKIVAIGGGTLGDLSGFIASTILRGVELILFPTTLLSQVDSSIGGKNGINTNSGKNLVGTFYQPKLVYIDPKILKSLSKREILSGYAEIIKHGIINDIKFFNWLNKNSKKILTLNNKILSEAIYKSIIIKRKYVLKDEKENLKNNNSRAILNFGHTLGHAIESYCLDHHPKEYITHGEAVGVGMALALYLSHTTQGFSKKELLEY